MNSEFESEIDIPLSATKVARIIEENSELRVSSVKKLGEGLEFLSFLINETWVIRFPKHVSEALNPVAEKVFSQKLKLSTAIPGIKFIWNHPWGYPETISGYEYLPGISLEHFRADEVDQDCLGRQLGIVLKELHTMSGVVVTKDSDPLASLRTWVEDLDKHLSRTSHNALSRSQRTTIRSYFDHYKFDLPTSESVLIHGDLGADHILLNEQKRLSGILDWSNHTRGNRYRDFVGIWRWGGDAFCERVLFHYPIQPSLTEMAFVRVMGLVNCVSRVILVFEQQSDTLRKPAHTLLAERLSEVTKASPYKPLRG